MSFSVTHADGPLGAEIVGVDLSRAVDDATFAVIRQALDDRGVIVVRDQTLEPQQVARFAERFGRLLVHAHNRFALPDAPAVLVLTMVDDDDTVVAAMRAGARGYILKGASGDEIVAAVQTVMAGGAVFGPGVASRVLQMAQAPVATPEADPFGLTEREREVVERLADGANNAEIAKELGLSLKTVQNYVSRVLDKLQVADRTQAALRYREIR